MPGLLHAAFVRSVHAHAEVRRVDMARARGAPGVAAALAGQDLTEWVRPLAPRLEGSGFWPTEWPALAPERVRFVGEPVAALCAESPAQGADACELVEVDYEPLAPIADVESALAPGAPLLHDGVPGNVLFRRDYSCGDVDAAFARAAVVLRETFRHGRCSASPLEARGLIASWERERLTVWTGTQAPHIFGAALARAFHLPEGHVRVIVPDTGGGFGQKMHVLPEDLAVAALAWVA
ncbi:MAG: molybdopterin-dependent oxidoreductase, partial [Candidatus Rokubacteria bacterium]|nr:molybdopterin-dependent oxidoreductase [Candidatus Rokubacteria bacterium]